MKKHIFITVLLTMLSTLFVLRSSGQVLNFHEDFSNYQLGATPKSFKTTGAASVARPRGQEGKWLFVSDKATYKLNRNNRLPAKFTMELDILATAEQIKDIAPICFGFVKDNATTQHISNGGTFVQLHYRDADAVNIGNYELSNKEVNTTFDLSSTVNRPLHIKLVVNGKQMAVYLDDTKLADTVLFSAGSAKYFYFSGPWEHDNSAKVFVSNFRSTF